MSRSLPTLLIAIAGTFGCGRTAVAPSPRPVPPAAAPVAEVDDPRGPWRVTAAAGSHEHRIALAAVLTSRVDTAVRVDTSMLDLQASWTRLAGAAPARLSGLVTHFAVGRDTATLAAVPGLPLPQPFAATDAAAGLAARLDEPASGPCALAAVVTAPLRELWLAVPSRVERGSTWHDSTRYTICRDSIPLEVEVHRTYTVVGAERRAAETVLLVDRESRTTMRGEGRQFGEPIAIEAEGTAAVRLAVRLDGVVADGVGDATLEMRMRGRRRAQELRQHTRIVISSP